MKIQLPQPDDWHLHLRDGRALSTTVPAAARYLGRALVMPNLKPPVTTVSHALQYRAAILEQLPHSSSFTPLMMLYLTEQTPLSVVKDVADSPHCLGFKLYPAGATTNSMEGVVDLRRCYPIFETMQQHRVPLCIHGEVTDPAVDIFDREAVFIDHELQTIIKNFPELRIVLEHVTTDYGISFVKSASDYIAATLTAHHLFLTRNDLLSGGIKPHYYCLPIVKSERDRQSLIAAAISGNKKFFLGSDSAPHPRSQKQSDCGCAGIFTGYAPLEYYAEIFDQHHALDRLPNFASKFGADFYQLPINKEFITLEKHPFPIPSTIEYDDDYLIPFLGGKDLSWRVIT